MRLAHRVGVMQLGKIVEQGSAEQILTTPDGLKPNNLDSSSSVVRVRMWECPSSGRSPGKVGSPAAAADPAVEVRASSMAVSSRRSVSDARSTRGSAMS